MTSSTPNPRNLASRVQKFLDTKLADIPGFECNTEKDLIDLGLRRMPNTTRSMEHYEERIDMDDDFITYYVKHDGLVFPPDIDPKQATVKDFLWAQLHSTYCLPYNNEQGAAAFAALDDTRREKLFEYAFKKSEPDNPVEVASYTGLLHGLNKLAGKEGLSAMDKQDMTFAIKRMQAEFGGMSADMARYERDNPEADTSSDHKSRMVMPFIIGELQQIGKDAGIKSGRERGE